MGSTAETPSCSKLALILFSQFLTFLCEIGCFFIYIAIAKLLRNVDKIIDLHEIPVLFLFSLINDELSVFDKHLKTVLDDNQTNKSVA